MMRCVVVDMGCGSKAYLNPDLVAAVLDDPHSPYCLVICGNQEIPVPLSSKELVKMIRNAEAGRIL